VEWEAVIQIAPQMRILVAVEAVDFRKGIDGLARVCKERLQADPFGGWLFVFRNRRGTAIKILTYDGRGFWLCQRRLSFWPASTTAVKSLEAQVGLSDSQREREIETTHSLTDVPSFS
jgi:transposase